MDKKTKATHGLAVRERSRRGTTIDAGTGLAVTAQKTAEVRVKRIGDVSSQECSRFIRQQVAEALPEICESLLEKAKNGDVSSAKALWQMAAFSGKSPKAKAAQAPKSGLAFARRVLAEFQAQ